MKKGNRRSEISLITTRGVKLLEHKLKGEKLSVSNENRDRRG